MLDFESLIFSNAAEALRLEMPGIYIGSEETSAPAKFPAATIVQQDNSVVQRMRTLNIENATHLMFEVNAFSNASGGYKKIEAKKIIAIVDDAFAKMGFTRTMCSPVDNLQDNTITRYVARYEGIAVPEYDEAGNIITYRIYNN